MKVSAGPRLAAEGEIIVTCLECGRRWKLEADPGHASFIVVAFEERIYGLRDHDCQPRPELRLVTN